VEVPQASILPLLREDQWAKYLWISWLRHCDGHVELVGSCFFRGWAATTPLPPTVTGHTVWLYWSMTSTGSTLKSNFSETGQFPPVFGWNPQFQVRHQLGKLRFYHWTTPA